MSHPNASEGNSKRVAWQYRGDYRFGSFHRRHEKEPHVNDVGPSRLCTIRQRTSDTAAVASFSRQIPTFIAMYGTPSTLRFQPETLSSPLTPR